MYNKPVHFKTDLVMISCHMTDNSAISYSMRHSVENGTLEICVCTAGRLVILALKCLSFLHCITSTVLAGDVDQASPDGVVRSLK